MPDELTGIAVTVKLWVRLASGGCVIFAGITVSSARARVFASGSTRSAVLRRAPIGARIRSCLPCIRRHGLRRGRWFTSTEAAGPNGLQIGPREVDFTGDGTGLLGGYTHQRFVNPHIVRKRLPFGSLVWTKWTTTVADGSGAIWLDDGVPTTPAAPSIRTRRR